MDFRGVYPSVILKRFLIDLILKKNIYMDLYIQYSI